MITKLNNQKMIWKCLCGQLTTYNYNYGGVNTKNGPFKISEGATLAYRIDNCAGNVGYIENIVFSINDFNDNNNVSAEELANVLQSKLTNADAILDHNCVLIQSKITGPTSCVEVIDGTARQALGYDLRGGEGEIEHFGCARLFLGFKMHDNNTNEDAIILRACPSCGMLMTLVRNHIDYSNVMAYEATLQRRAINSLAKFLIQNDWVDLDLVDFYSNENYNPTEIFAEFPDNEINLE